MSSSDEAVSHRPAGFGPSPVFTEAERSQRRRLRVVLGVVSVFFFLELFGAFLARSRVLRADAFHLLMDVFALAMSLVAMRLAVSRPSARFTFGLRRAEPLAALGNAALVIIASIEIVRDALEGLRGHDEPLAGIMLVVAVGALLVNGVSAWLLHGALHAHTDHDHSHPHPSESAGHEHGAHAHHDHHHHDGAHAHHKPGGRGHQLNLRGALLHLLGDALASLAALAAAILIRLGAPPAVDSIGSLFVALILVLGAIRLVRDACLVLLEAAPRHLEVARVQGVVSSVPGVSGVHELHVWSLGGGQDAITAHVQATSRDMDLARRVREALAKAFEVQYVTVQVELAGESCAPEFEPGA